MKPTQQEIIEQLGEAFDRAVEICGREFVAKSLLERFGAGGGEPVLFSHPDIFAMKAAHVGVSKPGHELPGYIPLYTHPSPADLRAEYLRGLEDAAKVADANATDARTRHAKFRCVNIAEAIRALKGKQ